MKAAVVSADLAKLRAFKEHGNDVFSWKDEANSGNGLVHLLVGMNSEKAQEIINFVKTQGNLDLQNKNGETALHMCCGKEAIPSIAKLLVLSGASL